MKILKAGDPKKVAAIKKRHWWVGKVFNCGSCKCCFELRLEDVHKLQEVALDVTSVCELVSSLYVRCPDCLTPVDIGKLEGKLWKEFRESGVLED